eukprot:CAMPEP_0205943904 /NCGR_PEP_ID=MMETSP1325-20131115/61660_1 /ASSEMBLY_ACC=CAM_ASM_000708 /TAXON_ID=236786 /ORGANISM="Florenciella sp., Strain RCC1007" /LENGTH=294 /DNA_ID=CAMNT_0053314747 /DNA_START=37 /DNA_END=921 /DNA_ORIENTATION=+
MARRLMFTCGSLVFATIYQMVIFCLSLSIITTIIQRELRPELDHLASTFSYVMHWQVTLVVLALMFMDAGMANDKGEWVIGCSLLAANAFMIFFVFINSSVDARRHKKQGASAVSFVPAARANFSNIPSMAGKSSKEDGRAKSKSGESMKRAKSGVASVRQLDSVGKSTSSFKRTKTTADSARWRFHANKARSSKDSASEESSKSSDATLEGIELTHNPMTHPGVSPVVQARRAVSDEPSGPSFMEGDFDADEIREVRKKKSESDGDEVKYQTNPMGDGGRGADGAYPDPSSVL